MRNRSARECANGPIVEVIYWPVSAVYLRVEFVPLKVMTDCRHQKTFGVIFAEIGKNAIVSENRGYRRQEHKPDHYISLLGHYCYASVNTGVLDRSCTALSAHSLMARHQREMVSNSS